MFLSSEQARSSIDCAHQCLHYQQLGGVCNAYSFSNVSLLCELASLTFLEDPLPDQSDGGEKKVMVAATVLHTVSTQYLHSICTVSTQYLHSICTVSTQYLHSIYTVSTQYLHSIYTVSSVVMTRQHWPAVVTWHLVTSGWPGTDLGSETRDSSSRERGYLDICSEGLSWVGGKILYLR